MIYCIKCTYDTGDTFGNWSESQILSITWQNIDIAKENIKRIANHYKYYQLLHAHCWENEEEKQRILLTASNQDWYSSGYDFQLNLKLDDGTMETITASWCGYFEILKEIEVITDQSDCKIIL